MHVNKYKSLGEELLPTATVQFTVLYNVQYIPQYSACQFKIFLNDFFIIT